MVNFSIHKVRPTTTKIGKYGFQPGHDCKLVYHRFTGKFFLHFVLERPQIWTRNITQPSENQAGPKIIALDPGVRTFLTGYCPDGEVVEFTPSDSGSGIQKLCRVAAGIDNIQRKISDPQTKAGRKFKLCS